MSIEEENKALVRRFYEHWRRREFDAMADIIAPGFVSHRNTGDISREDLLQWCPKCDGSFNIDDMIAAGNLVACRVIISYDDKEQTNEFIVRIVDGKWAEAWATLDN